MARFRNTSPSKTHEKIIEVPHEQRHPEGSFFSANKTISNIQMRLFGIMQRGEKMKNITQENIDSKTKALSELLHNTKNLANILAFSSHNGRNWRNDGIFKMQRGLLNQLGGGRAMEVLFAEAMMRVTGKNSNGYHFLPAKEMDLEYKMDMISRLPYRKNKKIETISFGSQITMARIPDDAEDKDNRYSEKLQQIKSIVPFLESSTTQKELFKKFGRLTIPQIISYVAINGSLARKIAVQ